MRKTSFSLLLLVWAFLFLSGCATAPAPDVHIEHVLVAPQDNLMVDCDVTPPPTKAEYMTGFKHTIPLVTAAPTMPQRSELPYDNISYVTQYVQTLAKKAEERERLQTNLNLKNYQNLDACNKRWKALREWKANALKELSNKKKE